MKLRASLVATLVAAILLAAAPEQPSPRIAPVADNYLKEAIAAFQTHHINRSKVDWTELTAKAYALAANAQRTADTYPAIEMIITSLGEKHSKFLDPDRTKAIMSGKAAGQSAAPAFTLPEGYLLSGGVGLIRLHSLMGSEEQAKQYEQSGQRLLSAFAAQGACGYIVDLRSDGGGNMWPMLNAVTDLFSDGVLGSFEKANNKKEQWVRRNRVIDIETTAATEAALAGNVAPVAVLLGAKTASAGEFTAMAFAGRPKTRFFGARTAGFVTANAPVPLSDGAMIAMTTGWGLDRTGKRYEDAIIPDENSADGGPTIDAALRWLESQGCG